MRWPGHIGMKIDTLTETGWTHRNPAHMIGIFVASEFMLSHLDSISVITTKSTRSLRFVHIVCSFNLEH